MNRSLRCLPVLAALALVLAPPSPTPASGQGIEGEIIIDLPCQNRDVFSIASLGLAGSATLTVYNPNGSVRKTIRGLDFGVDGATHADLSLPNGFTGSCVVRAGTPIVASVVQFGPNGTKTPVGLPASTTRGSDFLMHVLANEDRTITSEALFINPTNGPLGVDSFCNDAANDSASVSHWDMQAFGNLLMDPFLDADPSLANVDLTLACQQVLQSSVPDDKYQRPGGFTVINFPGTGDRIVAPGVRLADQLGHTQYIPLIHAAPDGSSRTSVTFKNVGPGNARGRLTGYSRRGKRVGKAIVHVAEGTSTTIDSITDELKTVDVTGLKIEFAPPVSTNGAILFVGSVDLPFVGTGAHIPTYTSETAFAERAGIPGITFESGDEVLVGIANAGRKKTRVRVRIIGADGITHLNRKIKVPKNGSGSLEVPAFLAGLRLHVIIDVLKRGPIMPYVEEVRASGEINFYPAQPFTPAQ